MNIEYDIPTPDINEAIEEMWRLMISSSDNYGFYSRYYPCLTITNEYEQIMQTKKHIKPKSNVLTVAGSGEQYIFFKLFGAENVLPFDCSYNSYLMTQLKIAALKTYDKTKDYFKFLTDLYNTEDTYFLEKENINNAINNLNERDRKYLCNAIQKLQVFYTHRNCNPYKLSETDYSKLRDIAKTPFPFILSDIKDLDKKLKGQTFDIIYYSNICDYLHPYDVRPVLNKTKDYLKPNGKLFLVTDDDEKDRITRAIDDTFGLSSSSFFAKKQHFQLIMIQNKMNTL